MITPEQQKVLDIIIPQSDFVRYVSMCAAGLVLLTLLVIGLYKPSLVNRVSLRLQAGVAFIDVLLSWTLLEFYKPQGDYACAVIGFSNFLLRHMYCFVNLSIAINLQLVFLHEIIPSVKLEFIYWGGSIGLALLLDVPLYGKSALDYFGFDGRQVCLMKKWVNYPLVSNLLVNTFSVFTSVYCLIIVVLVVIKLNKDIDILETNRTYNGRSRLESRDQLQSFLKKLITRVALYPMVCIITQSGDLASLFYKLATGGPKFELTLWSTFGNSSAGLLNIAAFLFDPTLHVALNHCYKVLIVKSETPDDNNLIELASTLDENNTINIKPLRGTDSITPGECLLQNTTYY